MRLVTFVGLIAVGAVVAYVLYWQHRFEPLLEAPGATLAPQPLGPGRAGAVRHVDLGYVEFDVPAVLAGDPVQHGTSLFVSLAGADGADTSLTICPPMADDDPAVRALRQQFADLTDQAAPSYWELRKQALLTPPFSVWTAPLRGNHQLAVDAALLLIKTTEVGGAEQFQWHEDDHFGVTVAIRAEHVFVQLADKRARTTQLFMLERRGVEAAVFARTLLGSYRLHGSDFAPEQLQARLKNADLPRRVTASARADPALRDAEKQETELKRIVEQLRTHHRNSRGVER